MRTNKPDKKESFEFEESGLVCVVNKTSMGHFCGYVEYPKDDRLPLPDHSGCSYDYYHDLSGESSSVADLFSVHGGITYMDDGARFNGGKCHSDKVFIGFDCAHLGDYTPSWPDGHKWTAEEVKEECIALAKQVKERLSHENQQT